MTAKNRLFAPRCACLLVVMAMLFGALFTATAARADDLIAILPYVVDNHDRVRAAEARLSAARNRAREALGAWYPTLSQTANYGYEKQFNDGGDDTATSFNEWDLSLTQLLWDFGSTNAAIDKARLQVEEARFSLIETRQGLILEAVTAYVNLSRAYQNLQFADESESNIREQTGLEEALVELGSGFSTDVLQAKTQLAGAQARKAQNRGALVSAMNRYRAVFGRLPERVEDLIDIPYPASYLPTNLTQAVDVALVGNPSLKNAILASDIAREDVRIARSDNYFPVLEGTAERKFKKNVGGTLGSEQETLAKVEMTFDFNLGLTAINTLKASEEDLSASTFSAADTRRNIEEQVRNAWQELETAQQTASHLNNQANIASAFLELARSERQLGRRSLIDVLSGETNLINARSDALSAETDVLLASYGLLAATGQLEYDTLRTSEGTAVPKYKTDINSDTSEAPVSLPTPPAVRIEPLESGKLNPDTIIATERSANDFRSLMAASRGNQTTQLATTQVPQAIELASLTPTDISFSRDNSPNVEREPVATDPGAQSEPLETTIPTLKSPETSNAYTFVWPEPVKVIEVPNFVSAASQPVVVALNEPLSMLPASEPIRPSIPKTKTTERTGLFAIFDILEAAQVKAEADNSDISEKADDPHFNSEMMSPKKSDQPPKPATVIVDEKPLPETVSNIFAGLMGFFAPVKSTPTEAGQVEKSEDRATMPTSEPAQEGSDLPAPHLSTPVHSFASVFHDSSETLGE